MALLTWQEFDSGGRPQGGTIEETVIGEVTNLISVERPLVSMLGSKSVPNTYVEQLTDTLRTRGTNVVLEGATASDPALTQPARHFSHVQSFGEWGIVSDEQRLVGHYSPDPFSYQIAKSVDQLMNDIEHAAHRGSSITGATDAGRQLGGAINIFAGQSGVQTYTSSSGTTLTEEVFIDYLQVFRDLKLKARPSQCYVNSFLKRTISEFSTKTTVNIDASAKIQMLVTEVHESDFGRLHMLYTEDQLASVSKTTQGNSIMFIDPTMFRMGWLKAPTVEQLPRDGLRDRFQINAQATLLYDHEKGGGAAVGLVPYIGQT